MKKVFNKSINQSTVHVLENFDCLVRRGRAGKVHILRQISAQQIAYSTAGHTNFVATFFHQFVQKIDVFISFQLFKQWIHRVTRFQLSLYQLWFHFGYGGERGGGGGGQRRRMMTNKKQRKKTGRSATMQGNGRQHTTDDHYVWRVTTEILRSMVYRLIDCIDNLFEWTFQLPIECRAIVSLKLHTISLTFRVNSACASVVHFSVAIYAHTIKVGVSTCHLQMLRVLYKNADLVLAISLLATSGFRSFLGNKLNCVCVCVCVWK